MTTCFKCGGKGYITNTCPSCQVNIVMFNNGEDYNEVDVKEIEVETKDLKKEPVEAVISGDPKKQLLTRQAKQQRTQTDWRCHEILRLRSFVMVAVVP